MLNIRMIKANVTIGAGEVDKMVKAITSAGKDITSLIKSVAQVASLLVGLCAGLSLLFVCLTTAFKAHKGDSAAWDNAAQTIAVCIAVIAFASAIFASFF